MSSSRLPLRTVAAYAAPAVPMSALGLPLALVVAPFYTTELGISQTLVGLIFTAVRLLDLVIDPVLGVWMDGTRTRYGRRRPWIAGSVPALLLGVTMLFMPPATADAAYLAIWAAVAYLAYSAITISHMSWGAELSGDYRERSRIQGAREFALVSGMLLVLALPTLLGLVWPETFFGRNNFVNQVASMGWFILILLPITVAAAWFFVPEPVVQVHQEEDWRAAWLMLRKNKALQRLLLADLFQGLAPGITASLYIFLIQQGFGLPNDAFWLLLVYFAAGLIGIPLWTTASYRFGKHRTLATAMFYGAAALPFMLLVPTGQAWIVATANVFYGLAYGAAPFLLRSILADVADEDTAETGKERAALYYSLLVMTNKLGYALAPGLVYPLLDLVGFSSARGAVNSPDAIFAMELLFVGLPVLFMLLTGLTMWNFPLDEERQKELRARIAERRESAAFIHPSAVPLPMERAAPSMLAHTDPRDMRSLLALMERLRDPESGCPWDREQTFATIAPYTVEEAYEVADAIQRSDHTHLKDELGDLLFQVVFHAQMAKEAGLFTFDDVVESITTKMLRRHPHIFGDGGGSIETAEDQTAAWEEHKKRERAAKGVGLLDDVPAALPALTRAVKLQKRAAQVGFDWNDIAPVLDKLEEELRELRQALSAGPAGGTRKAAEELGDILFVCANIARHLGVDPEDTGRAANAKFIRRFARIEALLAAQGRSTADSTLDEMEALWQQAKREEQARAAE